MGAACTTSQGASPPAAARPEPSYDDTTVKTPVSPSSPLEGVDAASSEVLPLGKFAEVHSPAPLPANEEKRLCTLRSLKVLDSAPESRFDEITKLCCMMFKVPICLVSLVEDNRQWFKSVQGLDTDHTSREGSFCAWTLLPNSPGVLVVENALADMRFVRNPLVLGPPHIRFYAGCPLVASNGDRLGSLCIIDVSPKTFAAESSMILANLAEMVVRELERGEAASKQRQEQDQMLRTVASLTESVMVVNLGEADWPVLFVNNAWEDESGVSKAKAVASGFWDMFSLAGNDQDQHADIRCNYEGAIKQQKTFQMRVRNVLPSMESNSAGQVIKRNLTLEFRNMQATTLAEARAAVGMPASAMEKSQSAEPTRMYYLVTIVKMPAARGSHASSMPAPRPVSVEGQPAIPGQIDAGAERMASAGSSSGPGFQLISEKIDPFDDVTLGPLLGRGAFGRVYHATLQGRTVAVKVMEHEAAGEENEQSLEAMLSGSISHPNIVQTIKHSTRKMPCAEESVVLLETWIVMELCDKGSLSDAVARGLCRMPHSLFETNFQMLLHLAEGICAGMVYLHSEDILHGDLTGMNVLLATDPNGWGGHAVRIADFGFSRVLASGPLKTKSYGTISHTPPELLVDGMLSKSADVYAFGVILWEMYMGQRPFSGMSQAQIALHISKHRGLSISNNCPAGFRKLIQACMHPEYGQRPTFKQVMEEIQELKDELC